MNAPNRGMDTVDTGTLLAGTVIGTVEMATSLRQQQQGHHGTGPYVCAAPAPDGNGSVVTAPPAPSDCLAGGEPAAPLRTLEARRDTMGPQPGPCIWRPQS